MNAVEYFKNNGFNKSKIHLDIMNAENWHNSFYNDLKRLVESWELVESYGGLNSAKLHICFRKEFKLYCLPNLVKAIADVEKCQ